MPPDPAPIRGRWTIRPHPQSWPSWNYADGPRPSEPVEVVPVPDEAAIERGAKAMCHADRMRHKSDRVEMPMWTAYLDDAMAVLRAALETPDEP